MRYADWAMGASTLAVNGGYVQHLNTVSNTTTLYSNDRRQSFQKLSQYSPRKACMFNSFTCHPVV